MTQAISDASGVRTFDDEQLYTLVDIGAILRSLRVWIATFAVAGAAAGVLKARYEPTMYASKFFFDSDVASGNTLAEPERINSVFIDMLFDYANAQRIVDTLHAYFANAPTEEQAAAAAAMNYVFSVLPRQITPRLKLSADQEDGGRLRLARFMSLTLPSYVADLHSVPVAGAMFVTRWVRGSGWVLELRTSERGISTEIAKGFAAAFSSVIAEYNAHSEATQRDRLQFGVDEASAAMQKTQDAYVAAQSEFRAARDQYRFQMAATGLIADGATRMTQIQSPLLASSSDRQNGDYLSIYDDMEYDAVLASLALKQASGKTTPRVIAALRERLASEHRIVMDKREHLKPFEIALDEAKKSYSDAFRRMSEPLDSSKYAMPSMIFNAKKIGLDSTFEGEDVEIKSSAALLAILGAVVGGMIGAFFGRYVPGLLSRSKLLAKRG